MLTQRGDIPDAIDCDTVAAVNESPTTLTGVLRESTRDAAPDNSSMLRALSVLETLVRVGRPVTLSDLMQITGAPKPSLHRTLGLFEDAGWLIRDESGRAYSAGPRLARFAFDVLTHDAVASHRRAVLRRLVDRVGETCNLAVLRRAEIVYLDRVEADWPLRLHIEAGTALPPHCCASGKLLLAFRPRAERELMLDTLHLMRFTPNTITDRDRLADEFDRIRSQGYALDNEEYVTGAVCVSVPVFDADRNAVAAVAVHAATARLPLARALEFLPDLRRAASAIEDGMAR